MAYDRDSIVNEANCVAVEDDCAEAEDTAEEMDDKFCILPDADSLKR